MSNPTDIDATLARLQERWDTDYAAFAAEYAAAHPVDDVETPSRKRKPLVFRERDVSRAIAGHMKAGLSVVRTEIAPDGRIVIVTGAPESAEIAPVNEWDLVR